MYPHFENAEVGDEDALCVASQKMLHHVLVRLRLLRHPVLLVGVHWPHQVRISQCGGARRA